MNRYQVYGITLASGDPLPGLAAALAGRAVDLTVERREHHSLPEAPSHPVREVLAPRVTGDDVLDVRLFLAPRRRWLRALYTSGPAAVAFTADIEQGRLEAATRPPAAPGDVRALLLHPVLAFVARLQGVTCLHANVVQVEGQAIALVGPRGAGKSTTSAALGRLGARVLADDVAALAEAGETFLVQPGMQRLRLNPAAATALYGEEVVLEGLWSPHPRAENKVYLGPWGENGHPNRPAPLAAIYLLGERAPDARPRLSSLSPAAALRLLSAHSYAPYLLDRAGREAEFALLGRLVARVPVRVLHRPEGLERLEESCQALLEDGRALGEAGER